MAERILPTAAGIYAFRYSVDLELDGTSRTLEFKFNPADGFWYLDLRNAANEPLVLGMRLALGKNKWKRYKYMDGVPKGSLDVVDVSGEGREAGADDLGVRVLVQYDAEATG